MLTFQNKTLLEKELKKFQYLIFFKSSESRKFTRM